jgi:hypothetical protein
MKNLKRLSVVLFATLLSFNFTSCIDDGVSDAVDQVYLAQAEFLKAQATLKIAEAAYEDARALGEIADAAYRDAETAHQQAVTAQFITASAETNRVNAAANTIIIAEGQKTHEANMITLEQAIITAQSAYDVAVVNLADAVQNAKDVLLVGYYGDLVAANNALDALMTSKLNLMTDKALKELYLSAPANTQTWAYVKAQLEIGLAGLQSDLAAEQATHAMVMAQTATPDQERATQLQDSLDLKEREIAEWEVVHQELENVEALALAAWNADGVKFADVFALEGDIATIKAEIKGHQDDSTAVRKLIDVTVPAAEAAIVTAEAADVAALAALNAAAATAATNKANADAALGAQTLPDPTAADAPLTGTSAWDAVYNARLDGAIALKAYNDGVAALSAAGIPQLETDLTNLVSIQDGLLPIATLEANLLAADAEESAAQSAWEANPTGFYAADGTPSAGPDGLAGDPNDAFITFAYITTAAAQAVAPGNANVIAFGDYPAVDAGVSAPIAGLAAATFAELEFSVNTDVPADAVGDYYDVEADDVPVANLARLQAARTAADNAQNAYDAYFNIQTQIDDKKAELIAAYEAATGSTISISSVSDFESATDYVNNVLNGKLGSWAATSATHGAPTAGKAMITPYEIVAEGTVAMTPPPAVSFRPAVIGLTANDVLWNAIVAKNDAVAAAATAATAKTNADLAVTNFAPTKPAKVAALTALLNAGFPNAGAAYSTTGSTVAQYNAIGEDYLAYIESLRPTHDYALAKYEADLVAMLAALGLDETLLDTEYSFGYLPSYAAWMDASAAVSNAATKISALTIEKNAIQNLRDAVVTFLSTDANGDSYVSEFEDWKAAELVTIEGSIDVLIGQIDAQEVLIAKSDLTKADMEAAVVELGRKIDVLDSEITIQETMISNLMATINSYLTN